MARRKFLERFRRLRNPRRCQKSSETSTADILLDQLYKPPFDYSDYHIEVCAINIRVEFIEEYP